MSERGLHSDSCYIAEAIEKKHLYKSKCLLGSTQIVQFNSEHKQIAQVLKELIEIKGEGDHAEIHTGSGLDSVLEEK